MDLENVDASCFLFSFQWYLCGSDYVRQFVSYDLCWDNLVSLFRLYAVKLKLLRNFRLIVFLLRNLNPNRESVIP